MADLRTITSVDWMTNNVGGFDLDYEIKAQNGLSADSIISMAYIDVLNYIKAHNENMFKNSDVEAGLTSYVDEYGRPFYWYRHGTLTQMQEYLDSDDYSEDTTLTSERQDAFRYAQSSLIISYINGLKEGVYNGREGSITVNQEVYTILLKQLNMLYGFNVLFPNEVI
jgi:hypothetical protein